MKKRVLCLLLATVMVLAVGCGSKKSDDENNEQQGTEQGTEESVEPTVPVEPETPDNQEVPEIQEPTYPATNELLDTLYTDVIAAYGDTYETVQIAPSDVELIDALFGISPELYTEGFAYMATISAHVDKFFAFKAADGMQEDLLAAVTAYQDILKADLMQYAGNLAKIQASQVVRHGDYVFFVMLGFIENEEQEEDGLIADYLAQNQIALDIIEAAMIAE